jgi:ABC-type transport system involved in multi-copper enzyme maturation permease subunit
MATMEYVTESSLVRGATADFWAAWIINCVAMLGLALLFLRSASRGLREEIAQPNLRSVSALDALRRMRREAATRGRSERVRGPALIWKDLRTYLPATRGRAYAGCGAALGTLAISYLPFLDSRAMDLPGSHQFYLFLYLVAGAFVTVLASSTAITVEKESRALPILLTAPITDAQIILSKATGVFYRALAAWILLTVHVLLFTLLGEIHVLGAVALILLMAYMAVFLTGLGLYVSSRLRSSSAAVTLTVGICFLLWYVLPMLATSAPSELLPGFDPAVHAANPFIQVYVIAHGAIDQNMGVTARGGLDFQWHGTHLTMGEAVGVFVITFLLYVNAGMLLAARAKVLMRRRLFV